MSVRDTRPLPRVTSRRVPGPVTLAFKVVTAPRGRVTEFALRAWPALFALTLIRPALHRDMQLYADGVLGFDAVLCLLACLAVTPFITVARLRISRLRWWYGIWVFVLGFAGVCVHLLSGPAPMAQRAAGTAVDWSGLLIVVLLLPMAATSTVAAQKALGPEWKLWQRGLIWVVTATVGLHLLLLRDWLAATAFGAALVPLIVLRIPPVRRAVKTWRVGGYSTRGLWVILAILCTMLVAALVILITEEGIAVARAIALTPA